METKEDNKMKNYETGRWSINFLTKTITLDSSLSTSLGLSSNQFTISDFLGYVIPQERESIGRSFSSYPKSQHFEHAINLELNECYCAIDARLHNAIPVDGAATFAKGDFTIRWKAEFRKNQPEAEVVSFSPEIRIPAKDIETELREQSQRISVACKVSMIYPWTWYIQDHCAEFTVIEAHKVSKKGVYFDGFAESIHPEDRFLYFEKLNQFAEEGNQHFTLKYRCNFFSPDQCYKWYEMRGEMFEKDANGKAVKAVGILKDITENKRKEEELKKLNILMDAILNNIPVHLSLKDPNNEFRYLYWNKAIADISGIPSKQAVGKTDEELFPNILTAKQFIKADQKALIEGGGKEYHEEILLDNTQTKDLITTRILIPTDQSHPHILRLSWDVTKLKRTEKELIQAKDKAEESSRLKTSFLANMSHEIRTPLNAIVGFSELLAHTQEEKEKTNHIEIIKKNNDLLLHLISDILDLSKIEAGKLEFIDEEIDVKDLCQSIVNAVNTNKSQNQVPVLLENRVRNCTIHCDKNRLVQIFSNLLDNALKFTTTGFIKIGYHLQDHTIEFYVEDTGIGIPPEHQEDIFGRFIKLNTLEQGTGLGLPICKNIIEQLQGTIGFKSEEGKGTRFWFTIPNKKETIKKQDENTPDPTGAREKAMTDPNKKPTILVAEDIESNYALLQCVLQKEYNLIRALDGLEALEKYKESNPDLILMDIKMPHMDGLEATQMIRKENSVIPIIALTAFAYDSDQQKAMNAGCNDYLTKPISIPTLKGMIKKYLTDCD